MITVEEKVHTYTELDPKIIGTVVVLQIFKRQKKDKSSIIQESLVKHAGTIRGYVQDLGTNTIKFNMNFETIKVDLNTHYVELYYIPSKY